MPKPLLKAPQLDPRPSRLPDPSPPRVAPWGQGDIEWADSPARLLHERLIETFAPPAPASADETLSPRMKLAILVGASAALWVVIGATVAVIV